MILALVVAGYALVPITGIALVVTACWKPEIFAPLRELLGRVFAQRTARAMLLPGSCCYLSGGWAGISWSRTEQPNRSGS